MPEIAQNVPELVNSARRMLLQSSGNNLAAARHVLSVNGNDKHFQMINKS